MSSVGSQLAKLYVPPCWPSAADPFSPLELLLHAAATNVIANPTTRTRSEPLIDLPPILNGPSCTPGRPSTNRGSVLVTRPAPLVGCAAMGTGCTASG